jgi:hypothetical protein
VFICQAFGVPAIGVGQPAHACVAYKAANPMTEPQPGSAWKVGYGRGWHVSKLEGMSGPEFLVGMEARANAAAFSQIEHLRWLAAALNSKNQAAAVLNVAKQIEQVSKAAKTDITASLKPEEAEKEITPKGKLVAASVADVAAIAVRAGETRISPERFSGSQAARVLDCFMGGKQVNFDKNLEESWVEYPLEVETAGTYMLEMRVAAANVDQVLNITTGDKPVAVRVPNTSGLWGMTPAAEIKLDKGRQTLRVSAPFQRGVAIQSLQLKPKS